MPIECVYFDLDDVLYDSAGFAKKARAAGLRALQTNFPEYSAELLEADMAAVIAHKGSNYPFIFDEVMKRRGISSSDPRYDRAIAEAVKSYHDTKYNPIEFTPFNDTKETLLALHKELKLGIITNGLAKKQWDKLIRLGLKEFFDPDHVVISERLGFEKPEPEIYRFAARKVGSPPERCVHIDDRPSHVRGANAVGMTGVLRAKHADKPSDVDQGEIRYVISTLAELPELIANLNSVEMPSFR